MNYIFSVDEEMNVPSILIDDKKLAVCNFDLSFETRGAAALSGHYTLVASGYFREEKPPVLRTYRIDLRTKECVEA